jgi:predicted phage terminase large subunit-like protein
MKKPRAKLPPYARVRDAILRTDLPSYIRKVYQTLSPWGTYYENWHILAIAHQLERVRRGEITRLIINLPPRSLKSLICSVAFSTFLLGHDPGKRIIGLSYSQGLATKLSNDCREIMNAAWYRGLFPHTKLSRQKNTESEFATTRMGYRISTSIEGTLTGRGGDLIIIDDPLKPQDALSDSQRERVNEAFFNTVTSRLDDQRTGAIIIVMQRLHEDDLVGRLLREQGEQWTVLSLPAIAEEDQKIAIGEGQYHVRRSGDVLHEERMPRSVLEDIRRQSGSDVFAAQYQQSPVPREGAMIKRKWPRRYDVPPQLDSSAMVIQSWDTAAKGGALSNYSVCTTWLCEENRYTLLDVYREQVDYPALKRQARLLAKIYNPKVILIEDAATGTALARELQAKGLPAIAVKPEFDKRTRMAVQSAKFQAGQVFLPKEAPWLDDLESELFSFPRGRHDDQIDSISQALAYEVPTYEWTGEALEGLERLVDGLTFGPLRWCPMIS